MTGLFVLDTVLWTVGLTVLFELVTVLFRFGFKLEATRDTAKYVARWTRGIRIHHGYWGVPLALIGAGLLLTPAAPGVGLAFWMLVLGLALIKSDLIHHFLVLWPITGSHDFHLRYPSHGRVDYVPDPIPVPASGTR
ncbi:hypothetical protein OT109_11315 [Phycisphaeraceae bacterium D3-23]